jgi:hypothetical protein
MELNIEKIKQGNISSLFPNLGKEVICNGCICEIIAVNNNQIQMRVIEPFKSGYKIGITFWNDSFLTQ